METSHLQKFKKFQMKSSDQIIFDWEHFGAIAMETHKRKIFELLLTFFQAYSRVQASRLWQI